MEKRFYSRIQDSENQLQEIGLTLREKIERFADDIRNDYTGDNLDEILSKAEHRFALEKAVKLWKFRKSDNSIMINDFYGHRIVTIEFISLDKD